MSANGPSRGTLAATALYARVLAETFRCSNPAYVIADHLRPGLSCEAVYAALADLREMGYIEAADGASGWCRITPEGVRAYERCIGGRRISGRHRMATHASRAVEAGSRPRRLEPSDSWAAGSRAGALA